MSACRRQALTLGEVVREDVRDIPSGGSSGWVGDIRDIRQGGSLGGWGISAISPQGVRWVGGGCPRHLTRGRRGGCRLSGTTCNRLGCPDRDIQHNFKRVACAVQVVVVFLHATRMGQGGMSSTTFCGVDGACGLSSTSCKPRVRRVLDVSDMPPGLAVGQGGISGTTVWRAWTCDLFKETF